MKHVKFNCMFPLHLSHAALVQLGGIPVLVSVSVPYYLPRLYPYFGFGVLMRVALMDRCLHQMI